MESSIKAWKQRPVLKAARKAAGLDKIGCSLHCIVQGLRRGLQGRLENRDNNPIGQTFNKYNANLISKG